MRPTMRATPKTAMPIRPGFLDIFSCSAGAVPAAIVLLQPAYYKPAMFQFAYGLVTSMCATEKPSVNFQFACQTYEARYAQDRLQFGTTLFVQNLETRFFVGGLCGIVSDVGRDLSQLASAVTSVLENFVNERVGETAPPILRQRRDTFDCKIGSRIRWHARGPHWP